MADEDRIVGEFDAGELQKSPRLLHVQSVPRVRDTDMSILYDLSVPTVVLAR
jgi:hypothetical protein